MVNRTINRGPKSVQGRMRSLANLRNVGSKLFVDKEYRDMLWEDGMNYDTQRDIRAAKKQVKEYNKVVKQHIIGAKEIDMDAVREWKEQQTGLTESISLTKKHDKGLSGVTESNFQTLSPATIKRRNYDKPIGNYVTANFYVAPISPGPPRSSFLPRPKKTYY